MEIDKNIIRLANLLLDSLSVFREAKLKHIRERMEEFRQKCSDVTKHCRLFDAAVEKGWLSGAESVQSRIYRNLDEFSYHLQRFKEVTNTEKFKTPKLSDIFAELSQIDDELGEYQFSLEDKTISVITEPITLGDIPLGPFEIQLHLDRVNKLYSEGCYRVIALEPNPAGSDDSVTHPHVSSEMLCEGDGHVSIRKALEQGRFCDFFMLIASILQTYNPDSPYVSLDDWSGTSCYDCGCTVSNEDCYYCEFCERDFCSSCSSYCQRCDTTICLGCAYSCSSCNEPVCQNCISKCKECEESFCEDCLNEEGLCKNCEEYRKENSDEEQENESKKAEACAEVQPGSVGQAAVHA